MTFIDHSSLVGTAIARPGKSVDAFDGVPDAVPANSLSPLEWRIVEVARKDGVKSLRLPRARSWIGRVILGPTPPSLMLADKRLEMLRRLAVHAWHHGYTLPVSAMKEAIAAGYSEGQVGAVVDAIVGKRTSDRSTVA